MKKYLQLTKPHKPLILAVSIAIGIVLFATFLRIISLTLLPVFADEAIYLRWAQVMKSEPTLRFLPLSDGKQPLYMWMVIPFYKLFENPLFAGRLLSVLSGAGSMVGIFVLSLSLFKSKKAALISLALYAMSPFSFFFHRMALVDATLSFFTVWVMVGGLFTARYLRLDFAMLTGFALGGAWLTKSPALFSALLLPFSLLFINKFSFRKVIVLVILLIVSVAIGYGFYNILRLGPNFHLIASRNLDYVLPYSHILTNPRDPFIFHVDRALEWIWILGPFPLLLLAVISTFVNLRRRWREVFFLLVMFSLPLLIQAEFAKVFTARYIFFTLPPLFVLSGAFILSKKNWVYMGGIGVTVVAIFLSILNISALITDPAKAMLPSSERSGYLSEWTAGDGIYEISEYIRNIQRINPNQNIVIGTEGYFGTLPDGLQIYLQNLPNTVVIGTGLNFGEVPSSLLDAKAAGNRVYFVVNKSRLNLRKDFSEYGLKKIDEYVKVERSSDTREYIQLGKHEILYFFELE